MKNFSENFEKISKKTCHFNDEPTRKKDKKERVVERTQQRKGKNFGRYL